MRSPEEMMDLILRTAKEDDRIRGAILSGSRANPDCPPDRYQDFDIAYYVKDVSPFWDNMAWIEACFGKPALLQKPESMTLIPPENDGTYVYLMLFPDGNRIDLTVTSADYVSHGEPAIVLVDKDGLFSGVKPDPSHWWVKKPTEKMFLDCANEFHWCLNNVAKGIARDELPYCFEMLGYVRDMLVRMLGWYVGEQHGFAVSIGKAGKYLKNYLSEETYKRYLSTYPEANAEQLWRASFEMVSLFGEIARELASKFGFRYDEDEEKGILDYMELVRAQSR